MQTNIVHTNSSLPLCFMSGVAAFIIYLLMIMILISIIFHVRKQVNINTYNTESEFIFQIDSAIELSQVIDSNPKESQQEEQTKPEETEENPEPTPTPQERIVKKPIEPNLIDVFSFIPSETIQNKNPLEEEKQRKAEEEARQKAQQEKLEREQRDKERTEALLRQADAIKQSAQALRQTSQTFKNSVNDAIQIKITVEKANISSSPDDMQKYDKWYDDIQEILMLEWQKNRFYQQTPTGTTVRIKVDNSGKLYYMYIVRPSPFNEYNNAVITFLRSMEEKIFPIPPRDSIEFNININSDLRY
ncbi:TonB C-terminal domain-containing protein [Helicobacter muridarum]|nr:TonB C-terminal domain-containing protein [Helicobacter muridarum]STQ85878.1 periplasmic protein TonB [Helicobacter muridarum]